MKNVFAMIILLSFVGCGKEKVKEVSGKNGNDGVSCYGEDFDGGVKVICGDEEYVVHDGNDGQDGSDGIDGQDGADGEDGSFSGYFEYVEVCPDIPGNYKESLMYLDGEFMAFLSDPNYKKQRLVILPEGVTYKTTDGRNVYFQISGGDLICL